MQTDASMMQKAIKKAVSANILRLRTIRGWTQEDLARRTGLSRETIANIESRSVMLSLSSLSAIARTFEVGLDEMLG